MKKKYKVLDEEQRYQIRILLDAGKNKSKIADLLGVHKSSMGVMSTEILENVTNMQISMSTSAQSKTIAKHRSKPKSS